MPNSTGKSIDDVIGSVSRITSTPSRSNDSAKSFLDEYQNPTFYIKNVSGKNFYISVIKETIPINASVDLLDRVGDMDVLTSDPGLRAAILTHKRLKRLTKEEFKIEQDKYAAAIKLIEEQKNNIDLRRSDVTAKASVIRLFVREKIDRLKMHYSNDVNEAKAGVTPVEFIEWLAFADLNESEINEALNATNDPEIRTAVFSKKAAIAKSQGSI